MVCDKVGWKTDEGRIKRESTQGEYVSNKVFKRSQVSERISKNGLVNLHP